MLIDKAGISQLLPHTGDMCLLDGVRHWDEARIECVTSTHRMLSNPMRRAGRLGIVCGVEYAAQAIALHAALAGGASGVAPRRGYLASLRRLTWHADRLDLIPGLLLVDAQCLHGEAGRAIYQFAVRCEDRVLLDGRAAVVVEPRSSE